jgi:type IV pilus assembly protein PilN
VKYINLVPWRAQARDQRKRAFLTCLAVSMLSILSLLILFHYLLSRKLADQQAINISYQQEITKLNKQLVIVGQLKQQRQAIITRISIIDKLQAKRAQTVTIFNDMVKALPHGIYLIRMKRIKNVITLTGKAESNIRISMFMRHLATMPWLAQTRLSQIQTDPITGAYPNDFVLELILKPLPSMDDNTHDN